MKREEITAIIEKNTTQNLNEIHSLLKQNSQNLKDHFQEELKKRKIRNREKI